MGETDAGDDIGPVVVRRPIYDAGMKLEAEERAGKGTAFMIAEDKAADCRQAGDEPGAAFWTEVYQFTMTRECVDAGTDIIILEEGETYDDEEEKVIRPGMNPPRSDTGSR